MKERRQKSFPPLKGKKKERSNIEPQQEQMKIRPGVWFWPLLLWGKNKNRLKSKGEWLSGNVVTKAESGMLFFVYKCIFTPCASKWKPVPRFIPSFGEERATQRGKHDNRVHSTEAWAASGWWGGTETWPLALSKRCLCTGVDGRFHVALNICCPAHLGEMLVSSHFVLVESSGELMSEKK